MCPRSHAQEWAEPWPGTIRKDLQHFCIRLITWTAFRPSLRWRYGGRGNTQSAELPLPPPEEVGICPSAVGGETSQFHSHCFGLSLALEELDLQGLFLITFQHLQIQGQ